MKIVVIDGQGGALGKSVVEMLKKRAVAADVAGGTEIVAIGTNSAATAAMLGAGADCGATGENSVVVATRDADIVLGPIGILSADAMLGEITPAIARAVGASRAKKILIPVSRCNVVVVGTVDLSYAERVRMAVELAWAEIEEMRGA